MVQNELLCPLLPFLCHLSGVREKEREDTTPHFGPYTWVGNLCIWMTQGLDIPDAIFEAAFSRAAIR